MTTKAPEKSLPLTGEVIATPAAGEKTQLDRETLNAVAGGGQYSKRIINGEVWWVKRHSPGSESRYSYNPEERKARKKGK